MSDDQDEPISAYLGAIVVIADRLPNYFGRRAFVSAEIAAALRDEGLLVADQEPTSQMESVDVFEAARTHRRVEDGRMVIAAGCSIPDHVLFYDVRDEAGRESVDRFLAPDGTVEVFVLQRRWPHD